MKENITQLQFSLGIATTNVHLHAHKEQQDATLMGDTSNKPSETKIVQFVDCLEEKRSVENHSLVASILQNIAHLRAS